MRRVNSLGSPILQIEVPQLGPIGVEWGGSYSFAPIPVLEDGTSAGMLQELSSKLS